MSVEIVLLCEDQNTNTFVRRFLRGRQFKARDIRTLPLPHGSQSGEQWVRGRYPTELKAIRSRQGAYLIVVIDADRHTTQQRRFQLDEECRAKEVQPRTDRDPVILLAPRRNIETWFAYLDGESVEETEDYSAWNSKDPRRFAEELYRMCHEVQRLREPVPASLAESCQEYRKLQR